MTSIFERLGQSVFSHIHGNNLVYNQCWEDPRLDRVALNLTPSDNVLVITSAGCNALDYALCEPNHVYAVDMNPRQNALLDLKAAGIRTLDYETFFDLFGGGQHPNANEIYRRRLRPELPDLSREYWDRNIGYFAATNRHSSFYFRGTSGFFAKLINFHIDRIARVRDAVNALMSAQSIEEQRDIYDTHIRRAFWTRPMRWFMGRDTTLSLVGVPRPQRVQVERHYRGGIAQFVEHAVESVFAILPIHDNYFWRVYLTGHYTRECCPEYLKPENFARLQGGLIDRISTHTTTVESFLREHDVQISRFVLLDHMDWLSSLKTPALQHEWEAILLRAAPGARAIWRSGGIHTDFIDTLNVRIQGKSQQLSERLVYHRELAKELHARDRVHTYGHFSIADLVTA